MSGIGGIIHWHSQPVTSKQIRHMMQSIAHRGPHGLWHESGGNVGLGFALLAMKTDDAQHPQPVWLPNRSCAIVADAVIYNRDDLLGRLGTVSWWRAEPSDAAIILAAYERWGADLLDTLDGDFAFAIWDQRHEQVFAARDPFSAKPLFYYQDSHRFFFGSEPKQLLTQPAMTVEPDDDVIGELLLRRFSRLERTFFKDIRRLKPAHYLIATKEMVTQSRWWEPDPQKEIVYKRPQEYLDQFRDLLKAAVAKRLNTDYMVLAHLSGGYDSSSIVVLADEIYRQNYRKLPPLETISYLYPQDPCDESPFIKAVLDRVAFSSNGVNAPNRAFSINEYVEETWRQDAPFFTYFPAFTTQSAQIMSERGARIQLSGIGGDELVLMNYELSDLVRHGRFLALAQVARLQSGDSASEYIRLLFDATKGAAPEFIKERYRWLIRRSIAPLPIWLSPAFATHLRQHLPGPSLSVKGFRSIGQSMIMQSFRNPLFHWLVESGERHSSWDGYETRLPYCDRALVEFVLAMPIEQRFNGIPWRYFQRQGLTRQLPKKITRRDSSADFSPYYKRVFSIVLPRLEAFLFSSEWLSEPYISRDVAKGLYKSISLPETDYNRERFLLLLDTASLEIWLRGLQRYRRAIV